MEKTKEKFNPIENYRVVNKNYNIGNMKLNVNNNQINNILNSNNENTNNVEANESVIFFNSLIWEVCFEIEIFHDNKTSLNNSIKKFITLLQEHLENKDFPLEIFSNQSLNTAYIKLIKISFICLIYLKFILTDFNYDLNLKSNIKTISNSLNNYLRQIISNFLLTKGTKDISINN